MHVDAHCLCRRVYVYHLVFQAVTLEVPTEDTSVDQPEIPCVILKSETFACRMVHVLKASLRIFFPYIYRLKQIIKKCSKLIKMNISDSLSDQHVTLKIENKIYYRPQILLQQPCGF